jgi:hypothetical protein
LCFQAEWEPVRSLAHVELAVSFSTCRSKNLETQGTNSTREWWIWEMEVESCRITCYPASKCKHCNASMSNRIFPAAFRDQHEHSRYSARNENMETEGLYTVNTAIFNSVIASSVPVRIKEIVGRTNRLLSFIEHEPHRKRRYQIFRSRGNVYSKPLSYNDKDIYS